MRCRYLSNRLVLVNVMPITWTMFKIQVDVPLDPDSLETAESNRYSAEISINPQEEGARSRLQARSLVGFPGAAVIEKGSRWEAVQRAGRLLKHRAPPLPSCS